MKSSIYRLEGCNQAEIEEMKDGEHGGDTPEYAGLGRSRAAKAGRLDGPLPDRADVKKPSVGPGSYFGFVP
jgi:hypothetical protein